MIHVIFEGRLGNNLFQYAAARTLDKDVVICIPYKEYYDNAIKYKDIFFKNSKILPYIPNDVYIWQQPSFGITNPPISSQNNICLKGYFQSYKYFNLSIIKKEYSIPQFILEEINSFYPEIIKHPFITMHVRRGDYLNALYQYPFCGKKYYYDALKHLPKDLPVIICSDDIKWCKQNFKEERFIFSENHSFLFDFFIQTLATHNIISNSSYSLWASFLNSNPEKIVCAPSLWFGFNSIEDTSEMLPPSYIIIKNKYTFLGLLRGYIQLYKHKLRKIASNIKSKVILNFR